MKHNRNLMNSLIGCGLALALISTAAAQGAMDGAAKVVRVKGPARYTTGNNVWQPLHVGDVLRAGTVVQTSTEEGSYVDLVLGDGNAAVPQAVTYRPSVPDSMASHLNFRPSAEQNVVRIWANTAMGIDKLTAMQTGADTVTETQLDLKQGRITGNVKKMSAASKYEVKLPNGVAGVRGTLFDIQAIGIVKVYVGSMVVAWVDPKTQNVTTQTVMGGQSYDAPNNQISPLSAASMSEFQSLSLALIATEGVIVTPTSLASDHTVIGMSPVGANPNTLPTPVPPDQGGGGEF
ncbi:MAG TPA: FecR domain-containing protein [Verrucomicrobiae bacterium]|nr:FecR domain-containing protein [Verrucomicrobiae bacterium]